MGEVRAGSRDSFLSDHKKSFSASCPWTLPHVGKDSGCCLRETAVANQDGVRFGQAFEGGFAKGKNKVAVEMVILDPMGSLHAPHLEQGFPPRRVLDLKCAMGPQASPGERLAMERLVLQSAVVVGEGMLEDDDHKGLALRVRGDHFHPGVVPALGLALKNVENEKVVIIREHDRARSFDRRSGNVTQPQDRLTCERTERMHGLPPKSPTHLHPLFRCPPLPAPWSPSRVSLSERPRSYARLSSSTELEREDYTVSCKIGAGGRFCQRRGILGIYEDSVAFPTPKDPGKCSDTVDFLRRSGQGLTRKGGTAGSRSLSIVADEERATWRPEAREVFKFLLSNERLDQA